MNAPNHFKIGMFILISTALLIAGIIAFGAGTLFKIPLQMETYIDESIQGLSVGSPVKYRGVQIGSVSEIGIVEHEYKFQELARLGRNVFIRWDVNPGFLSFLDTKGKGSHAIVATMVDDGFRVRLASQGITGLAYLELDYLENAEEKPKLQWEPKTCYVPSTRSTFTQVFSVVSSILSDVQKANIGEIGLKLQKLLTTLDQQVGGVDVAQVQKDASDLLNDLQKTSAELRKVVEDRSVKMALEQGAESFKTFNSLLKDSKPEIEKILANTEKITEDFTAASTDLPETIRRLNRNLQKLDRMISDNESQLTLLIENLTHASRDLKIFLGNAKEYPAQVFFGDPPPPKKRKKVEEQGK